MKNAKDKVMQINYFDQDNADEDDIHLKMAKGQGYVPQTCLLSGAIVMDEVRNQKDPCAGCYCPRDKCKGRPLDG